MMSVVKGRAGGARSELPQPTQTFEEFRVCETGWLPWGLTSSEWVAWNLVPSSWDSFWCYVG